MSKKTLKFQMYFTLIGAITAGICAIYYGVLVAIGATGFAIPTLLCWIGSCVINSLLCKDYHKRYKEKDD